MKHLLKSLKDKQLVDDEQTALLHNFGNMAKELFNNQLKNAKHQSIYGHRYSEEIKQFALTLHYY